MSDLYHTKLITGLDYEAMGQHARMSFMCNGFWLTVMNHAREYLILYAPKLIVFFICRAVEWITYEIKLQSVTC